MGRATVLALASEGAAVTVGDRDPVRAELVAAEAIASGGRVIAAGCDITDDGQVADAAAAARSAFGDVDLLINFAGASALGPFPEIPLDDWRWVLEVNVVSAVRLVNAFLPAMLERRRGHIVNTASISGLWAGGSGPYTASKFAVVGLAEQLAISYANDGVRSSVFCPGHVRTRFGRDGQARATNFDIESLLDAHLFAADHAPEAAAAMLLGGIEEGRFLILTDPEAVAAVFERRVDYDAFVAGGGGSPIFEARRPNAQS